MTTNTVKHTPLLPCPFCGGEASIDTKAKPGFIRIVCWGCGVATGYVSASHEGDPTCAWNQRSASSADNYIDQLNELCQDFGCEPGLDRLHWLRQKLALPPAAQEKGGE